MIGIVIGLALPVLSLVSSNLVALLGHLIGALVHLSSNMKVRSSRVAVYNAAGASNKRLFPTPPFRLQVR